MRIALLTKGLFPFSTGGIERFTHFLASHLGKLDCDVTVFTAEPDAQAPAGAGYRVPHRRSRSWWLDTRYRDRALRHAVDGDAFDVLYVQGLTGTDVVDIPRRPPTA